MRTLVGIDVGGTFTDLYSVNARGQRRILKVPSTPSDPSVGLLDALRAAEIDPAQLDALLHGTTIATNAVIERRGGKTALITTRGFRDVLELGRRDRPNLYGLTGTHTPLVPRDLRFEVDERLDYRGEVLTPLDEDAIRAIGIALLHEGVEAIVICFLHSYANPSHEERAAEILRGMSNDLEVVISTAVVREYYEFERTSSAVIQGYLQPLVARYARNLTSKLADFGFANDVLVMQSNGGLSPLSQLSNRAASIVRSGPAAGVMAASQIAAEAGFPNVITGDMGGTSFDVAVVMNGVPEVAEVTDIDFRIPLRIPMIDVHTIGAGGGSIASVDRGGILEVGPHSAGAYPGPIAYRRGGTKPTVTDANVVLGRINPENKMGGPIANLDIDAARKAIGEIGGPLGLSVEQAAEAILTVVNQRMAGRIRLLSIERGLDPRDFALVAFGGAGPLHCGALMREVGIGVMLVPPFPGVLCALGCAMADVRYDFSQTVERRLGELTQGEISEILMSQAEAGMAQLSGNSIDFAETEASHFAGMSYAGQINSLRVPVESHWKNHEIEQAFLDAYRKEFGNNLDDVPVLVANLGTSVTGVLPIAKTDTPAAATQSGAPDPVAHRRVFFGEWYDTPIYSRDMLRPGHAFSGPAVVEQSDTTTVIEVGMNVTVDVFGNLIARMN